MLKAMYSEPLVIFVMLFVIAKLMALRLPFFSAAVLAVGGVYLVRAAFHGYEFGPLFTEANAIRLGAALVLFFLLDRSEGRTGRWLLLFLITFGVFAYLL